MVPIYIMQNFKNNIYIIYDLFEVNFGHFGILGITALCVIILHNFLS